MVAIINGVLSRSEHRLFHLRYIHTEETIPFDHSAMTSRLQREIYWHKEHKRMETVANTYISYIKQPYYDEMNKCAA